MSKPKVPVVVFNELGGRIYVLTAYQVKPHPTQEGRTLVIASRKYDVTGEAEAAVLQLRRWRVNRHRRHAGLDGRDPAARRRRPER